MIKFEVRITQPAEDDLEEIYDFISLNQSFISANKLLNLLLDKVISLEEFALRGLVPPELSGLGVHKFRQIFLSSYRIIYSVEETTIYIHIIADSRQNMQALLEKRLLARSI